MNCIRKSHNHIFYGVLHFSREHLSNIDLIQETVQRDLNDSGLSVADLQHQNLVLDFRGEGQCNNTVGLLVSYFRSIPVRTVNVIFSTDVDVNGLDYPALSFVDFLANHESWFDDISSQPVDIYTDCNFLCLMRRPSLNRARLACALLNTTDSLRISFGSANNHSLHEFQSLFGSVTLPLTVDGFIPRTADGVLHHRSNNNDFYHCAVNIVAESSCQHEFPVWNSLFVTEKSYKPFGWLQIPIWWAVPGLVGSVRKLGFDLFDDVVNHSYDFEPNEQRRLEMVIAEVKRLNRLDLSTLRQQLKPRLESNWHNLRRLIVQNQGLPYQEIIKNFSLDIKV